MYKNKPLKMDKEKIGEWIDGIIEDLTKEKQMF